MSTGITDFTASTMGSWVKGYVSGLQTRVPQFCSLPGAFADKESCRHLRTTVLHFVDVRLHPGVRVPIEAAASYATFRRSTAVSVHGQKVHSNGHLGSPMVAKDDSSSMVQTACEEARVGPVSRCTVH